MTISRLLALLVSLLLATPALSRDVDVIVVDRNGEHVADVGVYAVRLDGAEDGHAWTFAYQYQVFQSVALAAEWLQIESFREAWAYYGLNPANTESQLQLSVRLRFGNR